VVEKGERIPRAAELPRCHKRYDDTTDDEEQVYAAIPKPKEDRVSGVEVTFFETRQMAEHHGEYSDAPASLDAQDAFLARCNRSRVHRNPSKKASAEPREYFRSLRPTEP
jgi:hypothetical protein